MDFYFMMEKKNYCQVALPAIHIAFDLQLYIHVLKLFMTESILMTGKYVETVESNFRYSRKGNRRCLLCYSFVLLDCN